MFMIYFHIKYMVPESRDSLVIAIKLKVIENFLPATMLLFYEYILQIFTLTEVSYFPKWR
jgi:hypothetical protein